MPPQSIRKLFELKNEQGEYEVPEGYGIWIRLDCHDGSVSLECVSDQHYTEIHPNCYAPLDLTEVYLLHGGGSGTAVFHGRHAQLGSIVMKHGTASDTDEVFALASINRELLERSHLLSPDAATSMLARIPTFVMVYLSPFHFRDRGQELWASLRGAFWRNKEPSSFDRTPDSVRHIHKMNRNSIDKMNSYTRRETVNLKHGKRRIRILKTVEATVEIFVCLTSVMIYIPERLFVEGDDDSRIADGIQFLKQLEEQLILCQKENNWKVTLAQNTIGGPDPQNGAVLLTGGCLIGDLRKELVRDFISVMKHLSELTLPNERPALENVRGEVDSLRNTMDVTLVSKAVDAFVGTAIRKNFHPVNGRFVRMRAFGEQFREENPFFLEGEVFPIQLLGNMLNRGCQLSSVFVDPPTEENALDQIESSWFSLLEHAVSLRHSSATDCIWTCGLTDAGLHNTFFSRKRGLELFDMGDASTMPQPAFLTKFLMSFFHTAGMEDNGSESWTRRFDIVGDKLALTPRTLELVSYLDSAFQDVTDRLMEELFEGDQSVRQLLVKYVVLQLFSDGAFCLDRWERKGGGTRQQSDTRPLEKWLWRCLWDCYIGCHVHKVFLATS
jgi:hypothetical protein